MCASVSSEKQLHFAGGPERLLLHHRWLHSNLELQAGKWVTTDFHSFLHLQETFNPGQDHDGFRGYPGNDGHRARIHLDGIPVHPAIHPSQATHSLIHTFKSLNHLLGGRVGNRRTQINPDEPHLDVGRTCTETPRSQYSISCANPFHTGPESRGANIYGLVVTFAISDLLVQQYGR